ncbi:MAG: hypothetical protein MUF72_09390 [Elainella sp. Prado103]|jgi:hypothetical protein|nr:hypothetical protein [Elainella sp. Prado103]
MVQGARSNDELKISHPEPLKQQLNFLRWGILLHVLPWTGLFCGAKWAVHCLGWEIWQFDLMTGSLFGAATFVIAFILSGTLADYRASEDMVAQLASAIESIQDTALLVASGHPEYDPAPLSQGLQQLGQAILTSLQNSDSLDPPMEALTQLNQPFSQIEPHTSGPIISRIQGEQSKMRLLLMRIQVIRDTEFLMPADILLRIFLVGSILALLLTDGDPLSKALVVSAFLFTSFVYLVRLIRDLDNPFQYDGHSCIDVELLPLQSALDRMKVNLDDPTKRILNK